MKKTIRRWADSRRQRALPALAAVALAGAALVSIPSGSAGAAPAPSTLPATSFTNIAYTDPVPATTKGNLLDVYLPKRRTDKPLPLFIFTEGSAWFADTGKSSGADWAAKLNPLGYAVAGVSVRSSAQAQFPGQLWDIKSAIRYLRANAARFDIDPNRFALGGFSSGAWTAAIAGVTNNVGADLEGTEGVTGVSSRVQAVVTFSAPVDFRTMDSQATQFSVLQHGVSNSPEAMMTGCTAYATGPMDPACTNAELANPVNYVTSDDPPFLMFHGTKDQLLPPGQSQELFNALAAKCVDAEFHLVQGPNHQYDYIKDPGASDNPMTGQTVEKVNRNSCNVDSTEGLRPGTVPSYGLVASFLARTIGPGSPVVQAAPGSPAPHAAPLTKHQQKVARARQQVQRDRTKAQRLTHKLRAARHAHAKSSKIRSLTKRLAAAQAHLKKDRMKLRKMKARGSKK